MTSNLSLNFKYIAAALILISAVGLADSVYLTRAHYRGDPVVCSIGDTQIGDCDQVTTSEYSTLLSVPVALVGVLYYTALFVLSLIWAGTARRSILRALLFTSSAGFIASLWFVYLQLFVINATCLYCMISALSTTALFLLTLFSLQLKWSYNNIKTSY